MKRGLFVIGHEHRTKHFNMVTEGRARVMVEGIVSEISAPNVFVSNGGVRKVLFILEDMRWITIHPTTETDLEILEDELIVKSDSYNKYEREVADVKRMRLIMEQEGSCLGGR